MSFTMKTVRINGSRAGAQPKPRSRTNMALSAPQGSGIAASDLKKVGIVFDAFMDVQPEAAAIQPGVPGKDDPGVKTDMTSFSRQFFSLECEAALNEQINVEFTNSYVYDALYAYFARDYVGLPGFASHFKHEAEEERSHAHKLIEYQNLRGGKVQLNSILMPPMEFANPEKGDALASMELSLALERLTNERLLALHKTADEAGDPQMCDFIESELLAEQVEALDAVGKLVSQLRRVGFGIGVFEVDKMLQQ